MLAFFILSPNPDRIFRTSCRISFWILLKSFFGLEFRWMKWISSMSLIPSTNLSTNQSGRFDFCFEDWRTYVVLKLDCLSQLNEWAFSKTELMFEAVFQAFSSYWKAIEGSFCLIVLAVSRFESPISYNHWVLCRKSSDLVASVVTIWWNRPTSK